jgi:hypothetical protein
MNDDDGGDDDDDDDGCLPARAEMERFVQEAVLPCMFALS